MCLGPQCSNLLGVNSGPSAQATGDIYSGSWVANKKSGQGVYQFGADDSTMHGTWVDGTITEGKWVFKVKLKPQQRNSSRPWCRAVRKPTKAVL